MNSSKQKFTIGAGVYLIALAVFAQTIKFYNDASIPQITVPSGGDVASIQQTGPNAYRWILLSDLREYMAGEAGGVVNVTIVNTNYTTNAFFTFLNVTSNATFNSTTFVNVSIVTNQTVLNTQYVNNTIITNLTVENNTTFKGQVHFSTNIIVTNGIATATNLWAGPTNNLNALVADQYYDSFTPVSVTSVVSALPGVANSLQLTIFNRAASNITMTLNPNIIQDNGGTGGITITNGTERAFWFKVRAGVKTNTISQSWTRS